MRESRYQSAAWAGVNDELSAVELSQLRPCAGAWRVGLWRRRRSRLDSRADYNAYPDAHTHPDANPHTDADSNADCGQL